MNDDFDRHVRVTTLQMPYPRQKNEMFSTRQDICGFVGNERLQLGIDFYHQLPSPPSEDLRRTRNRLRDYATNQGMHDFVPLPPL